ncbi:ribonuclease H-like domain-containing protein [Methanogenium sp. S4BF]|uniref:ribonuclease H-like domain-containing protein n=1 Tax=Methanogenium sp. S4BF TaxID=1789226 RepID=UPI00241773D5|nr:ribonuclease H-like domain-containing protein [Methanogenium sp. S4BF]WFN34354.1 ribonuclease H-like domain-containing protein [Methanogenium sp. S4BF]
MDTCIPESSGWFPGITTPMSAHRMQRALMVEYEGCTVEEVFGGHEIETTQGTCYAVETSEAIRFRRPDITVLSEAIMHELRLIPGIGEVTAEKMRRRGIRGISDLRTHSRFGADARVIADAADAQNWAFLEAHCCMRRSPSDNLSLLFSLTTPASDLLFVDIETLGIFSRPAILLGTGRIQGTYMTITQYLLRDIREEPGALSAVMAEITGTTRLVTYNGRAFDYPFIRDRAGYYGIPTPDTPAHTDLLHHVRRQWRGKMPDCRLGTVEGKILGRYREEDLPGSLVPWYYQTYRRSGNPGPLVPITEHNRLDIANLPLIYERLLEGCLCPQV